MKTIFNIHPWKLIETQLHREDMRLSESLTSTGNGYMGMRGNFEEKYTGDSHRGTYIGGVWFPDKTRVGWWKNGYPLYFGKVINAVDLIELGVSIDGQPLDLGVAEVKDFYRELDMETGILLRRATVKLAKGEVAIEVERFLSVVRRELLAIRYRVTPSFDAKVTFTPALDGNVRNEDSNYDETFWDMLDQKQAGDALYVLTKTKENPFGTPRFAVCAAMRADSCCGEKAAAVIAAGRVEQTSTLCVPAGKTAHMVKLVAVTTSRDHEETELTGKALTVLDEAAAAGYDALRAEQAAAWKERWAQADVQIAGDDAAQQGIRFNLFQLFCTYYGDDARLNIGPKGFTGEKYGGATYWDTEAYCLPMYMAVAQPEVPRNLLKYRYQQLEGAYHNAREQGLDGALYPMVTFNGIECHNEWEITFEEIHRNAAIAYAIFNYVTYSGETDYLHDYGIDVLAGIAKFWASRVHYSQRKGLYMIHGVTGPNEYENNINNNWYTNRMAKWCLEYTAEVAETYAADRREELGLTDAVLNNFRTIGEKMYLPEDKELGIFVAHDTFLDKDLRPAASLTPQERPINQKWSWDHILRSCFIKQADTLQGMWTLGHLYDLETKRRNYAFYEPLTVHESSLSPCVHSILAAEIGLADKAVEMYQRTARLDLDNINNDTNDGCHITSMAGSWLSIAQGFAGMRTVEGLSFAPMLPECWQSYSFKINYRSRRIEILVERETVTLRLLSGEPVALKLYGEDVLLEKETVRPIGEVGK
ncbi:MAG: glycoside hydrolase family 65 protein [Eubacteriales bacterium]|nr:glycoside hydrolase family 65 protein [Eubacteriales bacterium]